ncbi:MAG: APC family permease, partial [Fimbriimonadaceae bacterium]|nr:APC family permease [Fimbriimonadaceae bacterium]
LVLGVLLIVVATSYYQTIHAYPEGGGSYSVSRENLGRPWSWIAAAALLLDYVLTVAVSIAAGTAALVSMWPATHDFMVPIAIGAVAVLTLANLRGARESGAVFAVPTYAFIVSILALIAWGLIQGWGRPPTPPDPDALARYQDSPTWYVALPVLFMLKAFSASCTALTGVEAISNGVQAFRAPEAHNAGRTLIVMAGLLLTMFVGVSWAAVQYGVVPMEQHDPGYQTVIAQLATQVFGAGSPAFYFIQIATVSILFLAANTAFADFPRLAGLLAKDGLLPRYLKTVGDRLVFNNGILLLALVSAGLLLAFKADTHSLVPLYAVGVFTAFTISQAGMVTYWLRAKTIGWKLIINLVGAVATGTVLIVLAVLKFTEGAWVTIFAVGGVMLVFRGIFNYYRRVAEAQSIQRMREIPKMKTTVLILVPRVHPGILSAIGYAQSLTTDVRALHVILDSSGLPEFKAAWNRFGADVPLVILESPYRSLVDPVLDYVDATLEEDPELTVTVIVPQPILGRWWHRLLHDNAAAWLKRALGSRRRVMVTNVRYSLEEVA